MRCRLDFRRSLVSGLPSLSSGEERGLLSRTAAGNRTYMRCVNERKRTIWQFHIVLKPVFHASVLLLTMNFVSYSILKIVCGSTATWTILWRSSWSILGKKHKKLASVCWGNSCLLTSQREPAFQCVHSFGKVSQSCCWVSIPHLSYVYCAGEFFSVIVGPDLFEFFRNFTELAFNWRQSPLHGHQWHKQYENAREHAKNCHEIPKRAKSLQGQTFRRLSFLTYFLLHLSESEFTILSLS